MEGDAKKGVVGQGVSSRSNSGEEREESVFGPRKDAKGGVGYRMYKGGWEREREWEWERRWGGRARLEEVFEGQLFGDVLDKRRGASVNLAVEC